MSSVKESRPQKYEISVNTWYVEFRWAQIHIWINSVIMYSHRKNLSQEREKVSIFLYKQTTYVSNFSPSISVKVRFVGHSFFLEKMKLKTCSTLTQTWLRLGADRSRLIISSTTSTRRSCRIRVSWINSLVPGRWGCNLKLEISSSYKGRKSWAFSVKLLSSKCHKTLLMINHYWFR